MDDMQLDQAADLFITHKVLERHGWTFEQFLQGYETGMVEHLLEGAA